MLYRSVAQSLVVLFGISVAFLCNGGSLDHWHWRNPLPQGNSLLDVTANGDRYVAVGDHGTIITSQDGETWSEHSSGTLATLRAVAIGAGRFIAVGDFGTILTSTNATNWQFSTAMTLATLRGVTYAEDSFLAVGDNGLILSSGDGNDWSTVHTGPYTLEDVAFGNGVAVAVGGTAATNRWTDGNAIVLTSTNRRDWTLEESEFPSRVYSICFGSGLFAATTSDFDLYLRGTPSVGTSSNGVNWAHHFPRFYVNDVASGPDKFVAIGPAALHVWSYDGRTWITNDQSLSTVRPQAITHGPAGFVAVGQLGAIIRSVDGILWSMSSLWAYDILDIDYGNGLFIVLSGWNDSGSNVWVSVDGSNWSAHAPNPAPGALTFGNGVFVGSAQDGRILTTSNGVDWVVYQTESPTLLPATFCDGLFTVGYGSDHEYTSIDGINWTLEPTTDRSCLPSTDNYSSVAYGKGAYVRTTWKGEIWSSANGQDWILRQEAAPMITNEFSMTYPALFSVTFGGGVFVAVGGDGEFGGVYGTKPIRGTIYTSFDGITWSRVAIGVTDILKSAIYGNGTFVAIGYRSSTILQSDPFTSFRFSQGLFPGFSSKDPLVQPLILRLPTRPLGAGRQFIQQAWPSRRTNGPIPTLQRAVFIGPF